MSTKSLRPFAPLALAALVSNAFADNPDLTLYVTLDAAIAHIDHALNFDPYHPVANNPNVTHGYDAATGMLNGAMSATKWGVKGSDDLGGGWKAIFLLESGFNLPSGNTSNAAQGLANNKSTGPNMSADSAISGQFFSRGAFAGFSSNTWGTLTVGRQQSFFLDNIAIFDPILGSQAFSPMGFSGSYGGGGYTDDSRVDNSLKYRLAVGDFDLGALYKFGGVAGAFSAQSAWEANVVYAAGPLAIQWGYESFWDGFSVNNNTGNGTVKVTAADTQAYMISAKYSWRAATFRAGWEKEKFQNPANPTYDLQMTSIYNIPIAPPVNVNPFPGQQKTLNDYWLGIQYQFTPAISVLTGAWHVVQNDYSCANPATSSGCSGALNYYSIVGDYAFSKRTDVYLGVMDSRVSGGPANAVLNAPPNPSENSNVLYALGLRLRI
ncbi:MAG TPA: porin [Burkholderiaceae bacterium]|nr:porin [Burkholderiaceae bacterium]